MDINNPEHRKDIINNLLDFHNKTENDFWKGYEKFLEEIETEMNKRLISSGSLCRGGKIKLCNLYTASDIIASLRQKPFG